MISKQISDLKCLLTCIDTMQAVTNFKLGSSEDETSSSAGISSTSLAAYSSASHQYQASTTVADSSMSAQSMVALSNFTANSPAMQARLQRLDAFQDHLGATAPDLSSTPATNPAEAQQHQLQLSSQPYQQAEMFLGTSIALSAFYESAECDWGYAFRQPCSHAVEAHPCDDFVTSMALLMGKVSTSVLDLLGFLCQISPWAMAIVSNPHVAAHTLMHTGVLCDAC